VTRADATAARQAAPKAAPKKKVKAPPKEIGPMMEEDIIPGLMTVRRAPLLSPPHDANRRSVRLAADDSRRRATAAEPG
jgi:hypothetical protein